MLQWQPQWHWDTQWPLLITLLFCRMLLRSNYLFRNELSGSAANSVSRKGRRQGPGFLLIVMMTNPMNRLLSLSRCHRHVVGWVWHATVPKWLWPESESDANLRRMMQPPRHCAPNSMIGLYRLNPSRNCHHAIVWSLPSSSMLTCLNQFLATCFAYSKAFLCLAFPCQFGSVACSSSFELAINSNCSMST